LAAVVGSGDSGSELKGLNATKLISLRASCVKKQNGSRASGSAPGSPTTSEASKHQLQGRLDRAGTIQGAVIAAPVAVVPPVIGGSVGGTTGRSTLSELGGDGLGGLGGEVFNGPWNSASGPTQLQQRTGSASLRMGEPLQPQQWNKRRGTVCRGGWKLMEWKCCS
jgi:hypothetical protein